MRVCGQSHATARTAAVVLVLCVVLCAQIGGSGVLVQPMTYIFDEEPLRWQRLLENLGELLCCCFLTACDCLKACAAGQACLL